MLARMLNSVFSQLFYLLYNLQSSIGENRDSLLPNYKHFPLPHDLSHSFSRIFAFCKELYSIKYAMQNAI